MVPNLITPRTETDIETGENIEGDDVSSLSDLSDIFDDGDLFNEIELVDIIGLSLIGNDSFDSHDNVNKAENDELSLPANGPCILTCYFMQQNNAKNPVSNLTQHNEYNHYPPTMQNLPKRSLQ